MGYMQEKYTKSYYLKKDTDGKDTDYGIEGLSEFRKGDIRLEDKDILSRLEFSEKNVLDIGFGRGEALKFASDNKAKKLIGVDFSESAYEIANEFLEFYKISAKLYCCDAITFLKSYILTPRNYLIDIVIMLDCIEHIPRKEVTELFSLLPQILSKRGIVVINTPIFMRDNDVIADGLNPNAMDTSDEFEETVGMHCNRYTKNSLKSYMKKLGFTAISGHFFVPNLHIPFFLVGTKWAWKKAYNMGYPILISALNYPEKFEYAMTSKMLKKRKMINDIIYLKFVGKFINKCGKFIKNKIVQKMNIKKSQVEIQNINFSENNIVCEEVKGGLLKGYKLSLNITSPALWNIDMMEGYYDYFIYKSLKKYSFNFQNKIIWDVGAHIGYHSLAFSTLIGDEGKIIAFEPNPYNIQKLQENLKHNTELAKKILVVDFALSNFDGNASFVFSSEIYNGSSSGSHLKGVLTPEDSNSYVGFTEKLVKTFRGDTLITDNPTWIPNLIKIDVEGAEKIVLEGLHKTLVEYKPVLLIEVHNIQMMFYVQNILLNIGYQLEILDQENISLSRCFVLANF